MVEPTTSERAEWKNVGKYEILTKCDKKKFPLPGGRGFCNGRDRGGAESRSPVAEEPAHLAGQAAPEAGIHALSQLNHHHRSNN